MTLILDDRVGVVVSVTSNSEHLTIIVREGIGVGIQPVTVQQDGGVRQHHAGRVIVVEFLACDFENGVGWVLDVIEVDRRIETTNEQLLIIRTEASVENMVLEGLDR